MNNTINLILEQLDMDRQELDKKKNEYLLYINEHRDNVSNAYTEYILPLMRSSNDCSLKDAIVQAGINIQYHDLSKYSKEEFEPYRYKFFPTELEKQSPTYGKRCKECFDKAWEHHHQNNPHHLEHWSTLTDKRDMPLEYIIEMLCDWSSMSMYHNSSTREWYETEAQSDEALYMTPYTREWTERFLYELTPNIK